MGQGGLAGRNKALSRSTQGACGVYVGALKVFTDMLKAAWECSQGGLEGALGQPRCAQGALERHSKRV